MNKRFWMLFLLWCASLLLSVCIGRYPLSVPDIVAILSGNPPSEMASAVFYSIRLPRALLTAVSGGALALSGLAFQNVFLNPLVSPDVLGVTSGASVGAVFAILFLPAGALFVQTSAFLCGVLVVVFCIWLAHFVRRDRVVGMILAGIVVGSLSSAVLMLFKFLADPTHELPAIEYWLMGGFQNANWQQVIVVTAVTVPAGIVLYLLRFRVRLLSLGDDQTKSLGVSPGRVRLLTIACATLLVSAVVSAAGVVSWIGLLAPHIVRLMGQKDLNGQTGTVCLCGSILLLLADLCARSLSGVEIPVSIFTSLFGAVFLAGLLVRSGRMKKGGGLF